MTFDRRDMSARGRIGGYALRAKHDPRVYTRLARRAFLDRFMPNDPNLSEEERLARGKAALKAYMLRLSRKSAKSRTKRRQFRSVNGERMAGCDQTRSEKEETNGETY